MKQTRFYSARHLSSVITLLSIFIAAIYPKSSNGQVPSCPNQTGQYHCTVQASTSYGPTGQIYDDGTGNFEISGFTDGIYDITAHACQYWNCGNKFVMTGYTNTNISLNFSYSSTYVTSVSSHNLIITNLTTGVVFLNTFTGVGGISVPQTDGSVFILNAPTAGEYKIEYYRVSTGFTATPGVNPPDITAIVVLIPQIQKIWIDAVPICSGYAGDYSFQVHSYPEFSNIVVSDPDIWGSYARSLGGALGCDDMTFCEDFISIDFTGSTLPIKQYWDYTSYLVPSNTIPGNGWANALTTYTSSYHTPLDLNNYYISSADIGTYLSGGANYPGTPTIVVTFSDGITSFAATVPIVIEESISDILANPGSATTTPSYLSALTSLSGYAIGTPNPTFDLYNYTITPHWAGETWTPTNNPVTRIHGGGRVDTIRIEHSLTVNSAAWLMVDSGLRVEMGPDAIVTVSVAPTSTATGGVMSVLNSTFTSYRGCGGTDNSNWAGFTVLGNPAWPQWTGGFLATAQQQGLLELNGSKVEYAGIGIQNGNGLSTAGGIIYTSGSADTFYNNQMHVRIFPYSNIISGVENNSIEAFNNTYFITDANAWFPTTAFILSAYIKGAAMRGCSLVNNTGANISFGLIGYESGWNIATSTFSNFGTV